MQYIQLQGQDPSEMNTPLSGSYNLFVDGLDGTIKIVNSAGDWYGSGGGISEITYANLSTLRDDSLLSPGTFYKITDFKTCYDQPNYDYNGSAILTGNYKEGNVSPIIVFATSPESLAPDAYQPEWPNDNIKYDITFSQTEVTGGTAFGRITYRKDNQGNSFDYDFREVRFKRYDAYVSDGVYDGTVVIGASGSTSGIVEGTGTSFTNFSTGNIIGILKNDTGGDVVTYYQIVSIEDDTNMVVTGNVIREVSNARLVNASRLEGMSWKQNNIVSNIDDYEYPTFENHASAFNNASINTTAYTQFREKIFFLPNNVFRNVDLEFPNIYTDNLFGTDFRNNTFNDDCDSNIVRDDFRNNIITNSFDHNTINNTFRDNVIDCDFNSNTISGSFYENHFGDADGCNFDFNTIDGTFYQNFYTAANHFEYNLIKGEFYQNTILYGFSKNTLNGFYDNVIEAGFSDNRINEGFYDNKTYSQFRANTLGEECHGNIIYYQFYENTLGNYFRNNTIGDLGNLSNLSFYQNRIGASFEANIIRGGFDNNQLGVNFGNNTVNSYFHSNTIGNQCQNNPNIGYDFSNNHIGDYFNNNELIGDYFQNNQIGNAFAGNSISYNFKSNQIGYQFENNTLGNTQYFNWDNTSFENLNSRNYDTFYQSLYGEEGGENLGNVILGKELIMHDTINDEYHKVKFTQWTRGGNGGGFSYERTKVWPTVEPTVYFTKRNNEVIVDVIVEGSLEIRRGNGGAIYNQAAEGNWNNNQSPVGTEWNSIYTQNMNSGSPFQDNTISSEFKGNLIINEFVLNHVRSHVGGNQFLGDVYANEIGTYTFDNDFLGDVTNNRWVDGFYLNTIGTSFYNNNIQHSFGNNVIGSNFSYNIFDTRITSVDFTPNYGNISSISFAGIGASAAGGFSGTYTVAGTTNDLGVNASFDISVIDGIVDTVTIDSEGKLYETGDTITIVGTSIGGFTGIITAFSTNGIGLTGTSGSYSNMFPQGGSGENAIFTVNVLNGVVDEVILTDGGGSYLVGNVLTILGSDFGGVSDISITVTSVYSDDVLITVTGVSDKPPVYENYTCHIFERQGGAKRLSFYDSDDILTITDINE